MEQFKYYVTLKSIKDALMTGKPLSNHWGFPDFLLNDNKMLCAFFGSKAYNIYKNMTVDEKSEAIKWFEIHGVEVTKMYGGELHEDWNPDNNPVGKRDIKLLCEKHNELYKEVVKEIISEAYKMYPEPAKNYIISKSIEVCVNDNSKFEEILAQNVK